MIENEEQQKELRKTLLLKKHKDYKQTLLN